MRTSCIFAPADVVLTIRKKNAEIDPIDRKNKIFRNALLFPGQAREGWCYTGHFISYEFR